MATGEAPGMAPVRENDQRGRSLDVGLLDSDKWTLSWIGFCSWEALKRDAHVPKNASLCVSDNSQKCLDRSVLLSKKQVPIETLFSMEKCINRNLLL